MKLHRDLGINHLEDGVARISALPKDLGRLYGAVRQAGRGGPSWHLAALALSSRGRIASDNRGKDMDGRFCNIAGPGIVAVRH